MVVPATWTPIDEPAGLWAVERSDSAGFHWRSVAVRLPDRGALVYSPLVNLDAADRDGLDALGGAAALFAPNHFHHLAIAEYAAAYAGARAVCTDAARPRVERKAGVAMSAPDALAGTLPPHVEVLAPPGLATGEAWLRVDTPAGVTWVVSDAFFTLPVTPRGAIGLFCRLTGTTPGLRIGRTFTWLAVRDRRAYRAWLEAQLDRDRPVRLVPSHGDVLADDRATGGDGRARPEAEDGEAAGGARGTGATLVERLHKVIEERL